MIFFYIVIGFIGFGLFIYLMGEQADKKSLEDLQNYLIVAPKDNPFVKMYRIMGYGGGWVEFSNGRNFGFCGDNFLFQADQIIDDSSFRIISRTQS